jgi:PDZ domain-containing protein
MRRRGVTVLSGAILLALLLGLIVAVPVPYVELGPGPTVDTLGLRDDKPVITITGTPTTKSTGQLRMVTVNLVDNLTLIEGLRSWWSDDYAVVPRELIYPPNQTEKQVEQQNEADFKDSQDSAITSALVRLGYPIQVTVTKLADGLPAAAVLAVGDVLVSVDGAPVVNKEKLTELVTAKPAGTPRVVVYRRGGATNTVNLTAVNDGGRPRFGIEVGDVPPHPFDVKLQLQGIVGPSAGLMFALGITDILTPEDLTGGLVIAGTGTIDNAGKVGPIGGVAQKLVAAKAAGAKVFLTPADNCGEALANAQSGLPLARVATLDDAIAALEALRQKRTPVLCTR